MNDMSHPIEKDTALDSGTRLFRSRFGLMWLVLVLVTLFSWETAVTHGMEGLAATIVLLLAYFKVRLIGLEFMELRHAPWPMRIFYELWAAGVTASLFGQYWGVFG